MSTRTPTALDRDVRTETNAGGSKWANYDGGVDGQPDGDTYDVYRRPIGIDVLVRETRRVLEEQKTPIGAALMAALGCGTAANEHELLLQLERAGHTLGQLTLLDYSVHMTAHVEAKLKGKRTPWQLKRQDVVKDPLPFKEGSVHVATMFQCIQHLDSGDDPMFPNVFTAFERVYHSLAPGGALVVVASTPEQGRRSRWYAHLCDGKFDPRECPAIAHSTKWPPLDMVLGHLTRCGFQIDRYHPLFGPYIDTTVYLGDPSSVFDPAFQHAVSFFALAKRLKVHDAYESLARKLIDSGEIHQIREESEAFRAKTGVAYMVVARKKS